MHSWCLCVCVSVWERARWSKKDRTSWTEFLRCCTSGSTMWVTKMNITLKHTLPSSTHTQSQTDNKLSRRKSRGNSVTLTLDLCLLEAVLLRSDHCLPRVSASRICSCSGLPFCGWVVVLSSLSLFSPFTSFSSLSKQKPPLTSAALPLRTPFGTECE